MQQFFCLKLCAELCAEQPCSATTSTCLQDDVSAESGFQKKSEWLRIDEAASFERHVRHNLLSHGCVKLVHAVMYFEIHAPLSKRQGIKAYNTAGSVHAASSRNSWHCCMCALSPCRHVEGARDEITEISSEHRGCMCRAHLLRHDQVVLQRGRIYVVCLCRGLFTWLSLCA